MKMTLNKKLLEDVLCEHPAFYRDENGELIHQYDEIEIMMISVGTFRVMMRYRGEIIMNDEVGMALTPGSSILIQNLKGSNKVNLKITDC